MNTHFHPYITVEESHLATAPGAAFVLDGLLFNICDPGDGVLILAPCWSRSPSIILLKLPFDRIADCLLVDGFDWLVESKSGVRPVFVGTKSLNSVLTCEVLEALESAIVSAPCHIRGLLFTNPQNPLGQCYPKAVMESIIKFCHEKRIHFIADEIYALSAFSTTDDVEALPFTSTLQLDIAGMKCDSSRVHTIWSVSKDFGSSGLRMVSFPFRFEIPFPFEILS